MVLSAVQIQKLAVHKNVRRTAVENFLGTLGNERSEFEATQNLYADATAYGWNAATQSAIRRGIELFYGAKRR